MARKPSVPEIEPKFFDSIEEIDAAIRKLQRRITEIEQIDLGAAIQNHTGADSSAERNLQNTILEIYGPNSPEYKAHRHIHLWAGPMFVNMPPHQILHGKEHGRTQTIGIINGLIGRLKEAREDLGAGDRPVPSTYFEKLNLHPQIADVARDLFLDGHHFEAVFAAAKALWPAPGFVDTRLS